jgi:hypothetical protein
VISAVITSSVALVISAVIGYSSWNKESSEQSTTAFLEILASNKTGYCEFYQKFVDLHKTIRPHILLLSIVYHRGDSGSSSRQRPIFVPLSDSYSVLFYKSGKLIYAKLESSISRQIKVRHKYSKTFYFTKRRDVAAMP